MPLLHLRLLLRRQRVCVRAHRLRVGVLLLHLLLVLRVLRLHAQLRVRVFVLGLWPLLRGGVLHGQRLLLRVCGRVRIGFSERLFLHCGGGRILLLRHRGVVVRGPSGDDRRAMAVVKAHFCEFFGEELFA
jgi:hypothetical protein